LTEQRVSPPEHVERRRIAWFDTDASGSIHWAAVFRYAEQAEHGLMRDLGLLDHEGGYPRRRVEAEYHVLPGFDDEVDVRIWPEHVGTRSITWRWEMDRAGERCVTGTTVAVNVDSEGQSEPLADTVRDRLLGKTL
jgi:acyl-CoA thioester hydrolase